MSMASRIAGWLLLPTLLGGVAAHAQDRAEPLPRELEGVGIDEHLNAQLPLDLEFVDHAGKTVRLRDYFDGRRPVRKCQPSAAAGRSYCFR